MATLTAPTRAPAAPTAFELPVYADATLAGLAPLFPLPLVDWWLEERFRRRMADRIAGHRGRQLSPAVRRALNAGERGLLVAGLLFLLKLPLRLLKELSRKIFYVLAVKEATEKLSLYWQRAFLIDHMLRAGHLADAASARRAQRAMRETLRGLPSPFTALAGQLIQRIWELRPLRRRPSEAELKAAAVAQGPFIERQWAAYEAFLIELAGRYDRLFKTMGDSDA